MRREVDERGVRFLAGLDLLAGNNHRQRTVPPPGWLEVIGAPTDELSLATLHVVWHGEDGLRGIAPLATGGGDPLRLPAGPVVVVGVDPWGEVDLDSLPVSAETVIRAGETARLELGG